MEDYYENKLKKDYKGCGVFMLVYLAVIAVIFSYLIFTQVAEW